MRECEESDVQKVTASEMLTEVNAELWQRHDPPNGRGTFSRLIERGTLEEHVAYRRMCRLLAVREVIRKLAADEEEREKAEEAKGRLL